MDWLLRRGEADRLPESRPDAHHRLFNLKPGVSADDYEDWSRTRDIPGVRSLPSVDDFTVLRTTGLLGADGKPPYDYVEIIEVADMEGFFKDASSEASQAVAQEFRNWLGSEPVFMLTEELGPS